jgi:hypothetical protein
MPLVARVLAPHVPMLLGGVVEPDFNRVVSHKIQIISLRGTPQPPRSGAPDEFRRLATSAQEMLRLGGALDEVLFALGQATHFAHTMRGHSSLTERSSESPRSRGIKPSMTQQISGNRSFGTPWGRSGHGSYTVSQRRSVRSGMGRSADWARCFHRETRVTLN